MFINTRDKYSPKSLAEFVYPSSEVEELATAYASGNIDTPLILHGSSGSGKSLLQQLIPNAIENSNALVNDVKCADLKSASDIHNLYGRNKHFNRTFTCDGQRFNYIIIEEFSITNKLLVDAFKIELDKTLGTDLTIFSTNRFSEIDGGMRSRCEEIEVKPCSPSAFFPHAKRMFDAEGVAFDDSVLMKCLEVTYALNQDNRKYYQAIDKIFRSFSKIKQTN